jgi:hypothetical protein
LPSASVTPAAFVLSFGDVTTQPARETIGALVLAFTGGQANAGPSSTFNSVNVPKLDRIMRAETIVETARNASTRFQLIWQRTMEAIEAAFAGQQGQITDLSVIVARLEAAEAQASAAQAQSAATASSDALAKSYVEGLSISATSAGAITISAHTRVYGDGTSVSVNGGSLTGWSQGQYVQVYYDDAGKAGGAVAYQGTTAVIAQQGARHIVAGISIPVAGSPPTEGTPPLPPGYIPPRDYFEETI